MTAPEPLSITFGLTLDGYESAVPLEGLGEVTCGPTGLLQILETRLGLKSQPASDPQRAAQYLKLLEAVEGPRFYDESCAKDPIAVAETLLSWRDDLVESGWDGEAERSDSPRLQALAAIEARTADHLAPGIGDRLRHILRELKCRSAHIASLSVMQDLEGLPTLWQEICRRLGARFGVGKASLEAHSLGSDLARAQSSLAAQRSDRPARVVLDGDRSIILLTAFSEVVLAPAVAQVIDECCKTGRTVTLIAGQRAVALEQALLATNQPALGLAPCSLARPIPQTLALALRLYWTPVDPRALLEFLAHPVCPVPRRLARALAEAVVESPGIGGPRWESAIQEANAKAEEHHADDPAARQNALEEHQKALKEWLLVPRFDPRVGADGTVLSAACSRMAVWAASRASIPDLDPVESDQYRALSALASGLADLLKPHAHVSRSYLERLLQQVCAAGWPGGTTAGELGHVHRVSNPGAILEPADVVIWWDFAAPSPAIRPPWTETELEQAGRHGARFVAPEISAAQDLTEWLRAILAARRQLILVTPRERDGEPVSPHPLQARLVALLEDGSGLPTIDLDSALATGEYLDFLDHPPRDHRPLPAIRRWWKLPSGERLEPRDEESYSSLEKFIYSPYAWVLRYKAQLKSGSLTRYKLEDGSRLNGNLLHRSLDLLLGAPADQVRWQTCTEAEMNAWMDSCWDELLQEEGALLLLPGKRADAMALLQAGKAALWQLLQQLRAARVVEAASNQRLPAVRFDGGMVGGILDLSVRNKRGEWAIVDLKYGRQAIREVELSENRPLQLAVYGYLGSGNRGGKWPSTAFYILNKRSLLAQDDTFFPDASVVTAKGASPGLQACWNDFLEVWRWRRRQLDEGWVELTVKGTADLPRLEHEPDSTPPYDRWAAAKDQDQYNDFVALTGWEASA